MPTEPTIDDIDPATGQLKYLTHQHFMRDLRQWDREEVLRTVDKRILAGFAGPGLSMGAALAMVLSFQLNHSVLWAVLHGVCSWLYVIYRAWQGDY